MRRLAAASQPKLTVCGRCQLPSSINRSRKQARSKQCMVGPAEINMKLHDGGLGGTFQQK